MVRITTENPPREPFPTLDIAALLSLVLLLGTVCARRFSKTCRGRVKFIETWCASSRVHVGTRGNWLNTGSLPQPAARGSGHTLMAPFETNTGCPVRLDEKIRSIRTVWMFGRSYALWSGVRAFWVIWRAYMVLKPVHAPPIVELRRRGRRRTLKRRLRIAAIVIAATAIPFLGLLYVQPSP